MNDITTTTNARTNGTFQAIIEIFDADGTEIFATSEFPGECLHAHGTESSAQKCADWEAARRRKDDGSHWADQIAGVKRPTRRSQKPRPIFTTFASPDGETVSEDEAASSHEYVPMPELTSLWHAVTEGAKKRPAANLMFIGPSGSGKTDGARYLAALVGLPFTKVDAASMTDPEAWFGQRDLTAEDGTAVTEYTPSSFVTALQKPGVILLDEITRVRDEHRNILLPILDTTREVSNPLNGETVKRHPQCFIIMAGNVGLEFTGTNSVDPAFMTRALVVEFEYIDNAIETRVVVQATGVEEKYAKVLVRFASESRAKAAIDPEFAPISTRELIAAGTLIADGLDKDLAVKTAIINGVSAEGGEASVRTELQSIWNGVRVIEETAAESTGRAPTSAAASSSWTCPVHHKVKTVPAGVSSKTGRPYREFKACPEYGCENTANSTQR